MLVIVELIAITTASLIDWITADTWPMQISVIQTETELVYT